MIVPGMLVFSVTAIIISFMHVNLFSFTELADLLWFGWFMISSIFLAAITSRIMLAK